MYIWTMTRKKLSKIGRGRRSTSKYLRERGKGERHRSGNISKMGRRGEKGSRVKEKVRKAV